MYSRDASIVVAVVGTNTLNSDGVSYKAKQLYTHELYDYQTFHNDIGLVQLASPIQFTNLIKSIQMANFDTPAGTRATMTGWGYLSANGQIPNNLQTIDLNIISHQECSQSMNQLHPIITSQLCTFVSYGKGACN
ncbi:chymotrypsin-2-like, partial [Ctenocephalides felis]|uniref:chymotrypsin-2-like n=1 Tax=Ctenocephalides felis TaxID=7515 RepID=UPI000E6E19A5